MTNPLTAAAVARIREAMEDRKMSAADLSRLTGRTQQEIGRWLNGQTDPSVASLQLLAGALGLEVVLQVVPEGET